MSQSIQNVANKVLIGLTLLTAVFPLIPIQLTSVIGVVWFLISIYTSFQNFEKPFQWKKFILLASPFLLACLGFLFLDSSARSLKGIERNAMFLLIPLGFLLNESVFNKKLLFKWMSVFFAVVLFASLKGHILTINFVLDFAKEQGYEGRIWDLYNQPFFHHHYRVEYASNSGIHPTYSGILITISMLFFNQHFIKNWKGYLPKHKLGIGLINLIGVFCLAMVTARTPLLGFVVGSGIQIINLVGWKKSLLYLPLAGVGLFGLLYFAVPSFKQKVNEIEFSNVKEATVDNNNSFNIRTGILNCSMELLSKNWLFGLGVGGTYDGLNKCYEGLEFETYRKEKFNTHNQYLDYWISYGLIGLISLLLLIGNSIYSAIKGGFNGVWIIVLVFAISMLTENVLSRYYGVLPFVIIISFVSLKNKESKVG